MEDFNIHIPFTVFESDILKTLNTTPSQLRPNSWRFIKDFKIFCEAIDIEPTIGLFFSFFEIKDVEKGRWVTINGLPGKSFLQAYTTNYKGFKDRFLCIRYGPRCPQVMYALDGSHHFPIYWTRNPLSVSEFDFDKLTDQEVKSLAILDSFHMMKVRYLLYSSDYQMLYFWGNVLLFILRTPCDVISHSANFSSFFIFIKNDWHFCEGAEKTDARSLGGKERSRPDCC